VHVTQPPLHLYPLVLGTWPFHSYYDFLQAIPPRLHLKDLPKDLDPFRDPSRLLDQQGADGGHVMPLSVVGIMQQANSEESWQAAH